MEQLYTIPSPWAFIPGISEYVAKNGFKGIFTRKYSKKQS